MLLDSVPGYRLPLEAALLWVGGYLLGSIPVGWLVGKMAGVDLRQVGTGKIGTSNLFHTVGLLPAAFVGPLQFLQGLAPVGVALLIRGPAWAAAGAGLAAVIGNGWPFYFRYNGGRGVASATGAVALWSLIGFVVVLALIAAGGMIRRSGLSVLLAYLALPLVIWRVGGPEPYALAALGVVICLVLRRFDGYDFGRRQDHPEDSWLQRLVHDRNPVQASPTPQLPGTVAQHGIDSGG